MRSRLWLKLFFAFVVMTALALAAMTWALNRSLERGLLAYANEVESGQVEELADQLELAYQQTGNWRFLNRAPEDLRERFGVALRPVTGSDRRDHRPPGPALGRQEDEPGASGRRPAPPPNRGGRPGNDRHPRAGQPPRNGPPRDGPTREGRPNDLMALHTRLAIVNADNQLLAGSPEALAAGRPRTLSADGKTIGILFALPLPALESELDLAFATRQQTSALAIGGVILLISALAALLLARGMVRPVNRLANAARHLTGGRFDTRVVASSSDELGHLARDFNRLAVTLERNRAVQQDWLADVAHELRTPVAVLRGELHALQDGIRVLDGPALESLEAEVGRLSHLIEDLHQLSLSDAGVLNYRMEPCDLRDLVSDAVALASLPPGVELDLTITEDSVPVRADPNRLDQLLVNLMQNSIRYSDPPCQIQVQVDRQVGQGVIRWSDSAPGVPKHERLRIFERLYRVDTSRARETGGAGLGLAICSQVVAAHEGTIEAEDSLLGGLSVIIRLPLID